MAEICFETAYEHACFKVPRLYSARDQWLTVVLPYVQKYSKNSRFDSLIYYNTKYLTEGWRLGCVLTHNQKLNQKTYPDDWLGTEPFVQSALALSTDMWAGKIVPQNSDEIKGFVPLFAAPQTICPITGKITKWRIIRHGGEGSVEYPSINDLTPEENYTTSLPLLKHIMIYMYVMYCIWGFGFLMAKTDLSGAFRQLWLHFSQPLYVGYRFLGKTLIDLCDIWGTRAGSKHTQELGQLICRYFMLQINKIALLPMINKVIEYKSIDMMIDNTWPYLCDRSPFMCTSNDIYLHKFVPLWTIKMINQWIVDSDLNNYAHIITHLFNNGIDILTLSPETIIHRLTSEDYNIYVSFILPKINILKYSSDCVLKVVIDNYVDDYFFFLPPIPAIAQDIFIQFQSLLSDLGIAESIPKREGPWTDMVISGLLWKSSDMTVGPTAKCLRIISIILAQLLIIKIATITAFESLIGKLSNIAILAWPGKAFIKRLRDLLFKYIAKYGRNPKVWIVIPEWAIKDLRWWHDYLINVPRISIINLLSIDAPEYTIYVDGATNGHRPTLSEDPSTWKPGIGGFCRGYWFSSVVPETFLQRYERIARNYSKEFAIAHFEMLSVVVALLTFRSILPKSAKILIRTDNKTVESVFIGKNNSDLFHQDGLRWSLMFAKNNDWLLWISYINTHINTYADLLSRFALNKFKIFANEQKMQLKNELKALYPTNLDKY